MAKGVSAGQTRARRRSARRRSASLAAQQGAATKQISSQVASTKSALAKGAGMAHKAVETQHAATIKGLKTSAAKMRALVNKAPVMREDAGGVSGDVKDQLKEMSARGIVAGGKTAKLATNATGGAAKQAKTGLAAGAVRRLRLRRPDRDRRAERRVQPRVERRLPGPEHREVRHRRGRQDRHQLHGQGQVLQGQGQGQALRRPEQDQDRDVRPRGQGPGRHGQDPGRQRGQGLPGPGEGQRRASKEPKKPGGLWGKIVSAAKWVAEKLKAAFEFVAKLLTDPGFWVSLIVAVALTAFVIATFGSGLAVLVVAGAVIGAISAGAGQIVTNLASGKKWNEGLGTAMLIGGVTGLIPGLGKALGTIGSKIAGKFGTSVANSAIGKMGSKIASSALGKGAQALGRGVKNVGGKLASLGSKGLSTKAGRIISAPFRGAANLGTRLGNATREGLERRFPNVVKPNAAGAKPTSPTRAAHEEPSTTGRKPEVTDDADAVARDAAEQSAKVENPPPLQERIDRRHGRQQGPRVRPGAGAAQGVLRGAAGAGARLGAQRPQHPRGPDGRPPRAPDDQPGRLARTATPARATTTPTVHQLRRRPAHPDQHEGQAGRAGGRRRRTTSRASRTTRSRASTSTTTAARSCPTATACT